MTARTDAQLQPSQPQLPPQPPRILLAKLGLDGHDRGVKVIARALRDAGMEVVYLGMRVTAEQVAAAAAQEDVDVVGISILSGAHLRLMPRLVSALAAQGIGGGAGADGYDGAGAGSGVLLLVGGTIPDGDVPALRAMGVDGVFPVGSFTGQMVDFIRNAIGERRQGTLTENTSRGTPTRECQPGNSDRER